MTRRSVLSFLLIEFLLLAMASVSAATPAALDGTVGNLSPIIQQMKSDDSGLQFHLVTPSFQIAAPGAISVPGLARHLQEAGAPALPYYATYVALPPAARVTVSLEENDVTIRTVDRLPPASPPSVIVDSTALDREPATARLSSPGNAPDPAVYGKNALYPEASYWISEPMYLRDLRLVELRLYPLRYNPVQRELRHAQRLAVRLTFHGASLSPGLPSGDQSAAPGLIPLVLNARQAQTWRGLPGDLRHASQTRLPLGIDVYKIEVNQDGIYEISGADLAGAGMDIAGVDPNTLAMMVRGEPVAYWFVGDSDGVFEPHEKIRFFGWAFDGPRTERQFITHNVFWLWAGGTAARITTAANITHAPVNSTLASVTAEFDNHFFSTWTDQWDNFANEPDAWYWDYIIHDTPAPLTRTYPIDLPHPASSGPDAAYLVELMSRENSLAPSVFTYHVRGYLNNDSDYSEATWTGLKNVNMTGTVPLTTLNDGANEIHLVSLTDTTVGAGGAHLYLNRVTVEYRRQLVAGDDQIIFRDETGGRAFSVQGFSEDDAGNLLVWDLRQRRRPVQIEVTAANRSGAGLYTYTFGTNDHPAGTRFIATTTANVLKAAAISRYTPRSLDPPGGRAEWLAISHSRFLAEARRLAAHRASGAYLAMSTHVVDVEDVVNQYGYGLPLPAAIRDYLAYALGHWQSPPRYVTLFGDATVNPRNLACQAGCPVIRGNGWDATAETLVVTDLLFIDRYQGLIPSDYSLALLAGDDRLPDLAIGRIPAETAAEAAAVVAKIIAYEQNQFNPAAWNQRLLFVADDPDPLAGHFCEENRHTSQQVTTHLTKVHLCLPDNPTTADVDNLRAAMAQHVNGSGAFILNYRGHGSIAHWAHNLLTADSTDFWLNARPAVIVSADCLDGYFAWPGAPALSESFLLLGQSGTAAHWSSAGFGTTPEHSILHNGFYNALFDVGLTAIGDAVNYSKLLYNLGPNHESQLYSFNLQGDPALRLFWADLSATFVPSVMK